jgi:hypothetical protein
MQKTYEVPELTMVGQVDEVVLGAGAGGFELPQYSAADFEFEQD